MYETVQGLDKRFFEAVLFVLYNSNRKRSKNKSEAKHQQPPFYCEYGVGRK